MFCDEPHHHTRIVGTTCCEVHFRSDRNPIKTVEALDPFRRSPDRRGRQRGRVRRERRAKRTIRIENFEGNDQGSKGQFNLSLACAVDLFEFTFHVSTLSFSSCNLASCPPSSSCMFGVCTRRVRHSHSEICIRSLDLGSFQPVSPFAAFRQATASAID